LADNAYDLLQEARALMRERKPSLAVDLLKRAKALEPGRGSILETLGIAYFNCGCHQEARREFEEALEVDPTNHYARYGLSKCLRRQGRLQLAIGQVKLAVAMAPEIEIYSQTLSRYQKELEASGER